MGKRRVRQLGPDLFDLAPPLRSCLGSAQLDAHCWIDAMGQTWRIIEIPDSGMAYVRTRDNMLGADVRVRPAAVPAHIEEIRDAAAA